MASATEPEEGSLTFESFGVALQIVVDDERHLPAVRAVLPPGWVPSEEEPEYGRFVVVAEPGDELGDDLVHLAVDGLTLAGPAELPLALGILDAQLRATIALNAPDHIFVHAGVVGVEDRAIVLPAHSFAGKTTLVAALVAAGADYWSDEFAVLDGDGLVHPYPKPLSMRQDSTLETHERPVESLGGRAGERAARVALIANTSYKPGATWSPRRCSPGEGALGLLAHTVPARTRPEQALDAVRRASADALVLQGERGEAEPAAAALLDALGGAP